MNTPNTNFNVDNSNMNYQNMFNMGNQSMLNNIESLAITVLNYARTNGGFVSFYNGLINYQCPYPVQNMYDNQISNDVPVSNESQSSEETQSSNEVNDTQDNQNQPHSSEVIESDDIQNLFESPIWGPFVLNSDDDFI